MKRFSAGAIKFDTDFLKTLSETADSGVEIVNFKYHLALHPFQLNDFYNSLKEELSRKVARYDKKLQGVILGYKKIKLADELATINYDSLFIHTDIYADFFVFKPEIGKEMKGIVTKTTKDHVGCLVYKSFNVSLPQFECTEWLGNDVSAGDEVNFKVKFVDMESKFTYIRGELLSILTSVKKQKGPNKKIKFEPETDNEISIGSKKQKKAKRRHEETIVPENTINETIDNETTPKKGKRKKKEDTEEINTTQEELLVNSPSKRHKKVKVKKENPETVEITLEDLDLGGLFSSNNHSEKIDKPSRKRSHSVSHSQNNIKFEPQSDFEVEQSPVSNSNKKRKRSVSESVSTSPTKKKQKT